MNKRELIEKLEATASDWEVIIDWCEWKYYWVYWRQPITDISIINWYIIIS